MPAPYILKHPNSTLRAADWNQIQIEARLDIEQHDHTGAGKGTPLGTGALLDAAVTGAKIASGTITADKFDPNIDLGGSIGDGSITTVMLADAVVHAQKIAPGSIDSSRLAATQSFATLDVGDVLRLRASSVRAEYDALGFDWGWQLGSSIVGIPSPPLDYPIHARLLELDTVIRTIPDAMLPAIRVVSDVLEPELIRSLGSAAAAWAALAGDDARSMLAWAGVPNVQVALAHAFEVVDLAWQAYLEDGFMYPNLLLALARQGHKTIVEFATQATTVTGLLTLFEGGPFGQSFDELLAGTMRPLGTLDSENERPTPPLLQLDPDERFASSVFEVEAELGVRTGGYTMVGIGSAELPPPPGHWHPIASVRSPNAAGVMPLIRAQLQRAMTQLGQARTARLWGVTWRSGDSEVAHDEALLNVRVHGRTIGPTSQLATTVAFPIVNGLELSDGLVKREAPDQAIDMLGFQSNALPLLHNQEGPTEMQIVPILAGVAGGLPLVHDFFVPAGMTQQLLMVSGSAYSPNGGLLEVEVLVGATVVGTLRTYSNEPSSHKAFPTSFITFNPALPTNVTHTLTLRHPGTNTASDSDYFNACLILGR